MKQIIDRKELEKELGICKKVIGRGNNIAICQSIKIAFYEDGIVLQCTNLERIYQVEIGDSLYNHWIPDNAGIILVNADQLLRIVKATSKKTKEISLEITWDGEGLLVNGTTTIVSGNTDDYPFLPLFPAKTSYNLFSYESLQAINTINCNDDKRAYIRGIYVDAPNGQIVSTDGSRLYTSKIKTAEKLNPFLVDKEFVNILCDTKIRNRVSNFRIDKNNIFFELGNAMLSCRLLEGEFPDYGFLVEMLENTQLILSIPDKTDIIDALNEAMAIGSDSYKCIILNVNGGVTVSNKNPDVGEFSKEISGSLTRCGIDIEAAYNPTYIIDAIGHIKDSGINLFFSGSESPMVIESIDNSFQAFIMPMRT